MFMRTQRLFLRPIWAEDWRELQAAMATETLACRLAHVPLPDVLLPDVPLPDAGMRLREGGARPDNLYLPQLLVTRPDRLGGVEAIGCVGLYDDAGVVTLGCWVAPAHRGRGYATEAARGMLSIARVLGHGRIIARHMPENPASIRLLRRLGFVPGEPHGGDTTLGLTLDAGQGGHAGGSAGIGVQRLAG